MASCPGTGSARSSWFTSSSSPSCSRAVLAFCVGLIFAIPLANLICPVTYLALTGTTKHRTSRQARVYWEDDADERRTVAPADGDTACRTGWVPRYCAQHGLRRRASPETPRRAVRSSRPRRLAGRDPAVGGDQERRRDPFGEKTDGIFSCGTEDVMSRSLPRGTGGPRRSSRRSKRRRTRCSCPEAAGSCASLAIDGISPTQGRHQVAQKFRNTVLPLNSKRGRADLQVEERPVVVGRLAHARVLEQRTAAAGRPGARTPGTASRRWRNRWRGTTRSDSSWGVFRTSQVCPVDKRIGGSSKRLRLAALRPQSSPRVSATGASRLSTGA